MLLLAAAATSLSHSFDNLRDSSFLLCGTHSIGKKMLPICVKKSVTYNQMWLNTIMCHKLRMFCTKCCTDFSSPLPSQNLRPTHIGVIFDFLHILLSKCGSKPRSDHIKAYFGSYRLPNFLLDHQRTL